MDFHMNEEEAEEEDEEGGGGGGGGEDEEDDGGGGSRELLLRTPLPAPIDIYRTPEGLQSVESEHVANVYLNGQGSNETILW
ncbi:Protein of unknown function [Gryllus bimaculatus]|nr:Protein of unknown function [Gryllus bimaculatus]